MNAKLKLLSFTQQFADHEKRTLFFLFSFLLDLAVFVRWKEFRFAPKARVFENLRDRQNNISLAIENDATDDMLAHMAMGNQELTKQIADRIRQVRLAHNWSQKEVAARSEIPIATYRLFETTGRISLERLLRVATALHRVRDFENLLAPLPIRSIDDLVDKRPVRKRGRSVTV